MDKLHRLILGVLGLVVICIPVSTAAANEEPYVLIQHAADSYAGHTLYSLSIGYAPQAFSGQAWDLQGQPYAMNTVMREWTMRGTARKDWNERWTFFFGSRHNRFAVVEERIYPTHREEIRTMESTWGIQVGFQGKLQPGHPLDPKVGLSIGLPEQTVEAQVGLSVVRDPMILSGALGYGADLKTAGNSLTAGIGLGFVANDVLSVGVNIQHLMTMESWVPPANRLSLAIGYVVDRAKGRQVNFETGFWSDGERMVVSFGMGWTTQGS